MIGIGAGHPEHLTLQAIEAMRAASVFFVHDKGDERQDMAEARRELCARYAGRDHRIVAMQDPVRDPEIATYAARVEQWHEQRAALYEQAIETELAEDGQGAFLVWGDPMLYDSTLRILERVRTRGRVAFACEVIPGITSLQALMAAHQIPLNGIGESVLITTGRRLNAGQLACAETVAVMLDGKCAFQGLIDESLNIYWGAYVGMPQELLIAGPLASVAVEIAAARAQARARHGWIMDCYILRRSPDALRASREEGPRGER